MHIDLGFIEVLLSLGVVVAIDVCTALTISLVRALPKGQSPAHL